MRTLGVVVLAAVMLTGCTFGPGGGLGISEQQRQQMRYCGPDGKANLAEDKKGSLWTRPLTEPNYERMCGGAYAQAQIPGETKADPLLKRDITEMIKRIEYRLHGCPAGRVEVRDTRLIRPFDGKQAQERWDVLSCRGGTHAYEVNLMPSPGAGTSFDVRSWGR